MNRVAKSKKREVISWSRNLPGSAKVCTGFSSCEVADNIGAKSEACSWSEFSDMTLKHRCFRKVREKEVIVNEVSIWEAILEKSGENDP